MGTYTTNYQLYMPSVGETGWGTLVNGNFTTIDSTMKGLSNRITAVENEVNGNLSCTSVTASGKITGNGGIAGTTGTFSGAVTGASFNGVIIDNTVINNTHVNRYALGCTVKYQSGYNARIGANIDGGAGLNGVNRTSPYCIYMSYAVNGSGNFTNTIYLNQLVGDAVPHYITSIEGNYTYEIGAWWVIGSNAQITDTLKVVCNGKTYSAPAGETANLTLAQVNELLKYKSTVTVTTSSTQNHVGHIFVRPTTQNLYRLVGMY